MSDDRPDAIERFAWSLRRYWLLAVAVLIAVVAVVVGVGPRLLGPETYAAETLVVPRSLGDDLDPLRLSRFQQAVFTSGGVIDTALDDDDVPYASRRQLLEHVELAPVEDNLALDVVARDTDPAVAAEVANVVADALVSALNRVGSSAGVFTVHTEATPPPEPEPRVGLAALVVIGVLGGLVAAMGVVGTVGALRRPALSPEDAAEGVGAPVLGRLRLPAGRTIDPTAVLGLSALVRRLYTRPGGVCAFVSPRGDLETRLAVASLVGRALARRGPVLYVTSEGRERIPPELRDERIHLRSEMDGGPLEHPGAPTVVEGPAQEEHDLPQLLPGDALVVVVVAEGTPAARLQRLGQQFLPGELRGVLLVERERRRSAPARAGFSTRNGASDVDEAAAGPRDAYSHG